MGDSYEYLTFTVKISTDGNQNFFKKKRELDKRIKEKANAGWRVVSISPINTGAQGGMYDGGWGFGYTSHLLVTMEKMSGKKSDFNKVG